MIAHRYSDPIMKHTLLLLLTLLLLSCNQDKKYRNETPGKPSRDITTGQPETKADTSFWSFFEKFIWDKDFQRSRVSYPIRLNESDIQSRDDWNYLPFYTESEYIPTLASDTLTLFEHDVNAKATKLYIVDFKKKDVAYFEFGRDQGQWSLKKSGTTILRNVPDYEFIDYLINVSSI